MQQREGEEGADEDAQDDEQRVEHARRGLGALSGVAADVFAEKEVECRHHAACQQVILGDAEEIYFRKADQRPVAEEHGQHEVDPLREGQHQGDGEHGYRAGHHGRGDHREGAPQRQ